MSNDQSGRSTLIHAAKTPLGFFTVAVLIVEGILGLLASRASGWDFSALLGSMIVLIFLLVLCVALIVFRRPDLLLGIDAAASDKSRALEDDLQKARVAAASAESVVATLEREVRQLRLDNTELKARIGTLGSLKKRVWALINHSDSVSLDFVLRELDATNNADAKNDILATIGELIDEGKVEHASLTGYYRPVTKWAV